MTMVVRPTMYWRNWASCLLATAAAFAVSLWTGTGVVVGPLLVIVGLIAVMVGLHLIYRWVRPCPVIEMLTAGLAILLWSGTAAGILSLAALRDGAPLVDAGLARADELLHIDTQALVAFTASHAVFGELLSIAYGSTVPSVFATVILLAVLGKREAMWSICFDFAAGSFISAILLTIAPAVAAFTYFDVIPDVIAALPDGAGRFFLPELQGYRSGQIDTINVFHLQGVGTFPSFHAMMACMVADGLRSIPFLRQVAWAWCAIILISTIPIGGHYAIDIIGGVALWAGLLRLSRVWAKIPAWNDRSQLLRLTAHPVRSVTQSRSEVGH